MNDHAHAVGRNLKKILQEGNTVMDAPTQEIQNQEIKIDLAGDDVLTDEQFDQLINSVRSSERVRIDFARAEAALRRSLIRLKVARRKRRPGDGMPGSGRSPGTH